MAASEKSGKCRRVVSREGVSSPLSPRRLRAKYTHRTKLRFVLWVFRPCRGQIRADAKLQSERAGLYLSMPPQRTGRITYISSHAKQEHLYEVYATKPDRAFWRELAKCNQEEFEKSGTNGKCIEARELMIALPESFINYDHDYLLKKMVDEFKEKYGVECFSYPYKR